MDDLRFNVPDSAWLISSSVESRLASRVVVDGSWVLAAGIESPTFLG
jgi:hypothetical protein